MTAQFERLCESAAGFLDRQRIPLLVLYSGIFLVYFLRMDLTREMWSDEFYSLYISRLSLTEMWKAILTGADQHPPLYYLLTHLCLTTFGENQFVLRVPATIGFLVMTLCVFQFAANRLPVVCAFIAMVFPLLTGAVYYAQEGRGYGLVLGFSSLALLCWQGATRGNERRGLYLAGLALSLSAAAGCHYYAIFVLVPLAAGEISRAIAARRPDWPVWIAFSAPVVTLLIFLPAIQSARTYGATFWAVPLLRHAGDYFQIVFHQSAVPIVLAVLAVTAYAHLSHSPRASIPPMHGLRTHELAALGTALSLPLLVTISAKIGAGGFHPRYVLFPVIAFAILLAAGIAVVPVHRAAAGMLVLTLSTGWLALKAAPRLFGDSPVDVTEYSFLRTNGDPALPIVLSETSALFRLSYYAPLDISRRLVYLADAEASLKYLKHDTVDRGLLALRPWFPLDVRPYRPFMSSQKEFLVYGHMDGNWNWLAGAFADDRITTTILAVRDGRVMLYVRPSAPGATYTKTTSQNRVH